MQSAKILGGDGRTSGIHRGITFGDAEPSEESRRPALDRGLSRPIDPVPGLSPVMEECPEETPYQQPVLKAIQPVVLNSNAFRVILPRGGVHHFRMALFREHFGDNGEYPFGNDRHDSIYLNPGSL